MTRAPARPAIDTRSREVTTSPRLLGRHAATSYPLEVRNDGAVRSLLPRDGPAPDDGPPVGGSSLPAPRKPVGHGGQRDDERLRGGRQPRRGGSSPRCEAG